MHAKVRLLTDRIGIDLAAAISTVQCCVRANKPSYFSEYIQRTWVIFLVNNTEAKITM